MSDWNDACDPVPARREPELTDAQRAARLKVWKRRTSQSIYYRPKDSLAVDFVDPDFDGGK